MNRRHAVLPAAVALLAGGVAASVALGGGSAAVTVRSAFVKPLGKSALVTSSGLTLYRNMSEKQGRIRCTGSCATAWPPLLVPAGGKLFAGAGVSQSKLATVKRPDGKRQATYAGSPLYRFAADGRGQAKGQGLGGIWFAVTVAGAGAPSPAPAPSTPAPAPAPPPPPPTDTGYGTPY
jgi:predicted lipoprotein with Yx(FWY)xxD motif